MDMVRQPVRVAGSARLFPGDTVEKLDLARHLPWLKENTQQAVDVERFRWFSNNYLAPHPTEPTQVIDIRYSMLPNEIDALWAIELDPAATPDQHVRYVTDRDTSGDELGQLMDMLFD